MPVGVWLKNIIIKEETTWTLFNYTLENIRRIWSLIYIFRIKKNTIMVYSVSSRFSPGPRNSAVACAKECGVDIFRHILYDGSACSL